MSLFLISESTQWYYVNLTVIYRQKQRGTQVGIRFLHLRSRTVRRFLDCREIKQVWVNSVNVDFPLISKLTRGLWSRETHRRVGNAGIMRNCGIYEKNTRHASSWNRMESSSTSGFSLGNIRGMRPSALNLWPVSDVYRCGRCSNI